MSENPIADALGAPGHRASFHQGDALQFVPQPPAGGESSEVDQAALEADRSRLRVPRSRPRFGVDDEGTPIEPPLSGIPFDAETGTLAAPDTWATPEADAAPEPATKATTTSTRTTSTSASGTTSS